MKNIWTIDGLDPRKLFEAVPNRDPETAARFCLPLPNWCDENDVMQHPHPDVQLITKDGKQEFRYIFHNYEDDARQAAKINGNGAIVFTGPTPGQVVALRKIIADHVSDISLQKPEDVSAILARSYSELGLLDRFHKGRSEIIDEMDRIGNVEADPAFGNFVYKHVVSTCIRLIGSGEWEGGPTLTPQIFEDDAFLIFPGQSIEDVKKLIKSYDPESNAPRPKIKIASKSVFLKSRRSLDGHFIDLDKIPSQSAPISKIIKPRPISGFPEWNPETRAIEIQWLRTIAEVFERYGFVNIETPSAEPVEILHAKGEDQDTYVLHRSQAVADGISHEPKLGMHYDLTVPFARYVAQHFSELTFPFKRYQMQRVWRGERPQTGRFREFYQCDIDVVDQGKLSLEFDAEIPMILHSLVEKLDIGNVIISVNNRKILQGFYEGLGIESDQIIKVIRVVDGIGKIGVEGVRYTLSTDLGLPEDTIEKAIELSKIREIEASVTERVLALGVDTPLLREGLAELDFVMERLHRLPKGSVIADLSIVRDLSYYTGTIYEGTLADFPGFPPILGGGRYDNLVSKFMNRSLPGVGISFGLTRAFAKLLGEKRLPEGHKTPTQVLVTVPDEENGRAIARTIVDSLRARGIPAEMYHEPGDLARQLGYADKKGIPYAILPVAEHPDKPIIRNMRDRTQSPVQSIHAWGPTD